MSEPLGGELLWLRQLAQRATLFGHFWLRYARRGAYSLAIDTNNLLRHEVDLVRLRRRSRTGTQHLLSSGVKKLARMLSLLGPVTMELPKCCAGPFSAPRRRQGQQRGHSLLQEVHELLHASLEVLAWKKAPRASMGLVATSD